MRIIPTRIHGMLDYLIGAVVLLSPWLFGFANVAIWAHVLVGGGILLVAAFTDFELGLVRAIPMPVHLGLDAGIGLLAFASPWLFGFSAFVGLHVLFGIVELGAAAMTATQPTRRAIRA